MIAAHGLSFIAVANDGLVVAGQPVQLSLVASNRGAADVSVSGVDVAGFDRRCAACTPGVVKKDAAFTCTSAATVPGAAKLTEPYFTENYWKHPENPARNDFDPSVPFGVPFAPTPFHVTFHVQAGSVDVTQGPAGRIPLREGPVLRRQADGAERRAGVLGARHADAGRVSGADDGARRQADQPRRVRVGDQRHEGRGEGDGQPAGAGRMEGDAGERADHVPERRRVAVGEVSADRASDDQGRRVLREGHRHVGGDGRADSSATDIRRSSTRMSSGGR